MDAVRGQAFHLQRRFREIVVGACIVVRHAAPDHQGDQVIGGGFFDIFGCHILTIPQDSDAVGHNVQFTHTVADVNNADAAGFQLADALEQRFGLFIGQRACRLVHNNNVGGKGNRLNDLDHLLLGDIQLGNRGQRVEIQTKVHKVFLRFAVHFAVIHKTELVERLASQKHIFSNGQPRYKHQLLMDDADARLAGILYTVDGNFLAINKDLALVFLVNAAQNFDQGGFTGAILPQKRVDLAAAQIKLYTLQGVYTGKALVDACHLKKQLFVCHNFNSFGMAGQLCMTGFL